ncbi:hypothetical protein A4X09_0g6863 [Tilletia walkeri]|uniref:RNA-directed DNA polymerase n=1 Tax=Tilletia walkeri TaxID=117179 RepID=A0A8X7N1U8_9BASI|nr:hypothetical protein A4X09_0g6863 [Tilletia walkeri]
MRGDGQRSGPPPDLTPHGLPSRGVQLLPDVVDEQTANQDSLPPKRTCLESDPPLPQPPQSRAGSPVGVNSAVVRAAIRLATLQSGVDAARASAAKQLKTEGPSSALFFNDRAVFHTARSWEVRNDDRPLARPTRRGDRVSALPTLEATGSGLGYRRHVPLFTRLRINDTQGPAVSSLVDTGASLSSIDASLLENLGGEARGARIPVHGLGHTESLGFTTITFFVDAHDARGLPVQLEATQDFHVLPSFAPGLCLGLDFISSHQIAIDPAKGRATLGEYTFSVTETLAAAHAVQAELCLVEDVVLPARAHRWVRVDVGALNPEIDYAVHPRLTVTADDHVQIGGPMAVFTAATKHVLLTNFGAQDTVLERRTPVADAVAAHLGDTSLLSSQTFNLIPVTDTAPASSFPQQTDEGPPFDRETLPIDMFEGEHGFGSELAHDCATVEVDGHWRVGLNEDGAPHPEIVDLLRNHKRAFALDGRPGRVIGNEMGIKLVDDAALRPEAPRRASPEKRRAMDSTIDQLLSWDVIEPSASPVSFPVLMVRQRDKWRFCVDYRQLNASTVPDRYPLPVIDAVFNTLAGRRIFSSLDAIRGYHQLGVKPEDRWKTAFVCHKGLYHYKTVPFGLRNAPAVFQRLMDRILGDLRWKDAVVYIDDVVVASHTMSDHVAALAKLLSRAEAVGLNFSPAKCTFGVPSLVLLGRKVSGAGLAIWQDRASAVSELRRPTTLRELYHVLGLFGYYRPFIRNFAAVAEPLTKLTRGWRYEHANGRYRLTNAEGKAISADKAVFPWSLAAQRSFDSLKTAIANPPVLAHPDPTRPYILYVDASKHAFAAVLHQVFEQEPDAAETSVVDDPVVARLNTQRVQSVPSPIARDRWTAWLRRDRLFGPILTSAANNEDEVWKVENGLLIRRVDGRLALPEGALPDLLRSVHDERGHFGFFKTFLALAKDFWRPGLATAVRAWVKHCSVCQAVKIPRRTGELRVDDDPQEPFEALSVDLTFGFPRTRGGVDAVLVMLDVFSRMVLLQPCTSDITAEGIAAIVSDRVLRMGWRPRRLVSDSESRMTGAVMQSLARSLGATITPSPPHHQQANSVERFVQTVQNALRSMCLSSSASWDRRAVPAVELAVNSTPSVSTGQRPFDLVFISHPRIVHAVFDDREHEGVGSFPERLAAANARLDEARVALNVSRLEQKRRYDQRRQALPILAAGDRVFVRLGDRPVPGAITSKLSPRKLGPYSITAVLSPHRVRIALPAPLRISDEFSVEQLDVLPKEDDPFATSRSPQPEGVRIEDAAVEERVAVSDGYSDDDAPEDALPNSRPVRTGRLPSNLREYDVGLHTMSAGMLELLRTPSMKPRTVEVDGKEMVLIERPIAFLSRLTTVTEKRFVAPELELSCLAWAFGRLMHLVEGALVTVVTDHAPLGPMLTAAAPTEYGPTISRCRAMLMPHLPNLRFQYRQGKKHTNADALSRLVSGELDDDPDAPVRPSSEGGDVLDEE